MAQLGDLLVVVEEVGYVLGWQGDPAVVQQRCSCCAVADLSSLGGGCSDTNNHAQSYQEQHSQGDTGM